MSYPSPDFFDNWQDFVSALMNELEARDAAAVKAELTGTLKIFQGTSVGSGYLACDGSSFLAPSYPNLALLLGGTTLPNHVSPFAGTVVGIKT